jgi:hypothetical protein
MPPARRVAFTRPGTSDSLGIAHRHRHHRVTVVTTVIAHCTMAWGARRACGSDHTGDAPDDDRTIAATSDQSTAGSHGA